ncbi:4Fe-4S dicluster domain-containing protein [Aurantimonas sp. MSK8Z-1]|uniref:4Fe-4S dicluster domain-containing protein n=1 Tax=Mangrovibrevibacter kandeliae TaxID=2968473 RepID=UPI002118E0D6|nr:4Fe-4S dicluster domain-containing protein [Aurantimonas sp. MSK8Z-1]MCW4116714.1 4Fe-4S dicluster domain-containing protein [Aurantimonas sp. MSK8Z-1]
MIVDHRATRLARSNRPPAAPGLLSEPRLNRRDALRLLGLALTAGVAGCRAPEDIVPAIANLDGDAPGVPLHVATTLPLGGYGRGVLAKSVDGRPIKVSGNPDHPASFGATDIFAEADILGLYDPERARSAMKGNLPLGWEGFLADLAPRLEVLRQAGGAGLSVLTGRVTSPTLIGQLAALKGIFPQMQWRRFEPLGDDNARAGSIAAFGRPLDLVPHLDRADVVFCLGADPLGPGPGQIRNAQGFRQRRTVRRGTTAMQRLYAVESATSLTGAMADHRLALSPEALADLAHALAARLGSEGAVPAGAHAGFVDALAADLTAAQGRALVLVGEEQPPALHALGHWLNQRLGAFGATVELIEPVDPVLDGHGDSLAALVDDLEAGRVDTLVMLGTNPVYTAPADLDVAAALAKTPFTVQLGLAPDETTAHCDWHLAETHPLEAWSDLRAVDGMASLVQPLIAPLYATKTAHEVVAALAGEATVAAQDLVRRTWQSAAPVGGFDGWWRRALETGVVPGSAAQPVAPPRAVQLPPHAAGSAQPAAAGITLMLRPDATIWDGAYSNNAWLQECPKPVSHLTWGNALALTPEDANRLGLAEGDAARIGTSGRWVEAPVRLDRGLAPGTASLSFGYGRTDIGAIGLGLGANAYALRTRSQPWQVEGLTVERVGRADEMPVTQFTLDDQGRDLAPVHPLSDLLAGKLDRTKDAPASFYGEHPYEAPYKGPEQDYAWAMVIDTTLCIGCNACVVACQSENNVPVVGPDEIRRGRDMHWLRIDAYETEFDGQMQSVFQPVPCMHCEEAPCEPVCPVGASVHDHEGLNVQVYNRCVGTRFCQANCPYKVRRFNFFGYADGQEYANLGEDPLPARYNPDVTVRARGVMEKCTYCVQRISGARRDAEKDDRRIREGEVVTACQSACPTQAIQFGDLGAPDSRVRPLRDEPQHHVLLEEVGTKPRTTYLSRLRNPNPALAGDGA